MPYAGAIARHKAPVVHESESLVLAREQCRRGPLGPSAVITSAGLRHALIAGRTSTVAGIAAHIGAHEATVRLWIRAGEFPAAKLGSRIGYRIKRSGHEEFLHRRSVISAITRHLLRAATLPQPEPD